MIKNHIASLVLAMTAASASTANANLLFMRGYTNPSNNKHTTLLGFSSIQDMASANTAAAHTSLAFSANVAFVADYYFTDGTRYYPANIDAGTGGEAWGDTNCSSEGDPRG